MCFLSSVLAWVLLCSVPAFSQTSTGSVGGFVLSVDGAAIEGASVKVEGPGTTRDVKTNARGYYLVPLLPPGEYHVTVDAPGLGVSSYAGLIIEVATAARLDFRVEKGVRVHELVTVTAGATLVQTSETQKSLVVSNQVLDGMPIIDRNFMSSILILPGVTGAGDSLSISGGEDMQKNYNIDGMDNNDIAQIEKASANGYKTPTDQSFSGFDQEAIKELSVATSGYGADQGYGSGGVINVVTKSGTNELHGSGYLFARNEALDTDITAGYKEYLFGGSLGGAIKKDHLYYFLDLNGTLNDEGFDNRQSAYVAVPTSMMNDVHNFSSFAKLTWKINSNQTLNVSTNILRSNNDDWDNAFHPLADIVPYNETMPNVIANISHTFVLGAGSILESTVGYSINRNVRINPSTAHAGWIMSYDANFNLVATGENQADYWDTKDKVYWAEKISHTFSNHSVTAGFDYRWFRSNDKRDSLDTVFTLCNYYAIFGDPCEFDSVEPPYQLGLTQSYLGAFVKDSWRMTRKLTLNAGVRVSRDSFIKDIVAEPRVGLAYDPTGTGKTVIRGAFSLYSDRINLYAQQIANAAFINTIAYNHDGTLNPANSSPQLYQPFFIDPNLVNPRTYEGSAGIERQLPGGLVLSGNYIYRNYTNEVTNKYTNLLDPVTGLRADPTKSYLQELANIGWSKYQGFFVVLRKTGNKGRYQFLASYGYQRSNGNTTWIGGMGQSNIMLGDPYAMTTASIQTYQLSGPTDFDKPYEFKVFGSLNIPKIKDLVFSGVMRAVSGTPYSDWNSTTYTLVGTYQDQRSPNLFYLDMQLQKNFRFGERVRLEVKAEAFNVTNHENILYVNNDVSQSNFGTPLSVDNSRRIQLGTRVTF
jgi:hypothetical protein